MFRIQCFFTCLLASSSMVLTAAAQTPDTPKMRFRPIGSPSAVDQYRTRIPDPRINQFTGHTTGTNVGANSLRETAHQTVQFGPDGSRVRHAMMQQPIEAPSLPRDPLAGSGTSGGPSGNFQLPMGSAVAPTTPTGVNPNTVSPGFVNPGVSNPGVSNPGTVSPGMTNPGTMSPGMSNPGTVGPSTMVPSSPSNAAPSSVAPRPITPRPMTPVPYNSGGAAPGSDLTPIAPPQLGGGFATIDNCNCVSAPSNYIAASATMGCAPVGYSYQAPAGYQGTGGYQPVSQVVPAGTAPASTGLLPGNGIPCGPLLSFGQDRNPVQVGQGILGQPVAYVPGQHVRNWIRYLFP